MPLKKDYFSECSNEVETCPVVCKMFEDDEFFAIAEYEDMSIRKRLAASKIREALGNLVEACTNGNCPGQAPELIIELKMRREQGES
ncbi:MAG: hypothetical protein U5L95_00425 [Candidatus Saccharibacteria bacterium]|nr:hypothetical protein [Candidatus Saccharibacteria bacterium]